jgi:hypothetical protein
MAESSSFLKKRTKKLLRNLAAAYPDGPKPKGSKVFCFFFSKKTAFLP